MVRLSALLILLLATSACAGDDGIPSGETNNNNEVREENPDPNGPGNNGSTSDAGNNDEPDLAGCPANACATGRVRCEGAGVQTCVADPDNDGCGMWGSIDDCDAPGETCVDGSCTIPGSCVDNDGDGYGPSCAMGDDCDDNDADVNPGASELCDDIDNDCDTETDEGFDVGMPCTVGTGACMGDGFLACSPDGSDTVCSGMQMGEPEICDGMDNDCDGVADNGVCGACQSDIFEPNDTIGESELLQAGQPKYGYLCPGDTDWFELETQSNKNYGIFVSFPESISDVLVEGYVDGSNVVTGDTFGRDWEVFSVNGDANTDFNIEVIERDGIETIFRISLVEVADIECSDEDGFVPNQTIENAAQLPPFWVTQAYMCPGQGNNTLSDYFFMGELTQGDAINLIVEGLDLFGTDLDLYLWADPQGDGTFEVIESSEGFGDFEQIQTNAPHTGDYIFQVFDYDGYGGNYDVGWSLN